MQHSPPRPGRVAMRRTTARTATVGDRELLFFGGCSYLALAHEPRVVAALAAGAERHGVSSGASRETTGNVEDHEGLERELAAVLDLEEVLLLPEGGLANLALGESLRGEFPAAVVDRDAHATVVLGATTSGGRLSRFDGPDEARAHVEATADAAAIWTDSVFPAEGRLADLGALLAALPGGRGLLVVDDCHGFGVLGPRGRGALAAAGLRDPRVVVTGTLSKALGTYGGFVAGARSRIARVRERSTLYSGTTPLAPPLAAAARAALALLVAEPERHARYQESVRTFRARLRACGVPLKALEFPVVAFELAPPERMRRVHEAALREGVYLPLIQYAGCGTHGCFRIVWNAAHTSADLERLCDVLKRALATP